MLEELKVSLPLLEYVGSYFTDYEYKKVTVGCFVSEVSNKNVSPDNFEIATTGWFPIPDLPEPRASSVDRVINFIQSF